MTVADRAAKWHVMVELQQLQWWNVTLTQVDWDEVLAKLTKLETECKTSWDHLRVIVKHDMAPSLKSKYEVRSLAVKLKHLFYILKAAVFGRLHIRLIDVYMHGFHNVDSTCNIYTSYFILSVMQRMQPQIKYLSD